MNHKVDTVARRDRLLQALEYADNQIRSDPDIEIWPATCKEVVLF